VFPQPFETFTYTDGGTFQNEPLGLAKSLVDGIDPTHTSTDPRFYLFIAPHAKTSIANSTFNEKNENFYTLTLRLVNAVFGQAGFQDWIQADEINEQVRLFNARAEGLKNSFLNPPHLDPAPLQMAANELLPRLFDSRPPGSESLAAARQRLKAQFSVEYQALITGPGQAAADAWIDSILTLETAADLGDRDVMTIYGITADASELAGAGLQAFLGFFEQQYRDHDYDVGRMKAQSFLDPAKNPLLGQPGNFPKLNYTPASIRPIDPKLNGLALKDVPENLRQAMMDRLENRADDLLKEAGVNFAEREAIKLLVLRSQLKKFLQL
jgi:hypothetical protein